MTIDHPKTTTAGYLIFVGSIAYLIAHVAQGTLTWNDVQAVMTAAGGVGLIVASDGGH